MPRGVFYRGDRRRPYDDGIFEKGFQKRDWFSKKVTPSQPPEFRPMGAGKAEDVKTATAVCVTKDFFAAPLFPVRMTQLLTWIYFLDLDVDKMFNTQQYQREYVAQLVGDGHISGAQVKKALWPMYGQERAVDKIKSEEIIGTVHVERKFNGDGVLQGGVFRCLLYVPNANYGQLMGPATAREVASIIATYINDKTWLTIPSQSQGIVASNATSSSSTATTTTTTTTTPGSRFGGPPSDAPPSPPPSQ